MVLLQMSMDDAAARNCPDSALSGQGTQHCLTDLARIRSLSCPRTSCMASRLASMPAAPFRPIKASSSTCFIPSSPACTIPTSRHHACNYHHDSMAWRDKGLSTAKPFELWLGPVGGQLVPSAPGCLAQHALSCCQQGGDKGSCVSCALNITPHCGRLCVGGCLQ